MSNIYYVYVYLNPLVKGDFVYDDYHFDYEPFYIGKGKGNRYKVHLYKKSLKRRNIKNNIIKQILGSNLEPIILKVHENLNEFESYEKETYLIKRIGRIVFGIGSLANMTDGGDGARRTIISEETRKKLSECGKRNGFKGKTFEEIHGLEKSIKIKNDYSLKRKNKTYIEQYGEEKAKIVKDKQSKKQKGKVKITEDGKRRLREFHTNRKRSKETKDRISKSLIGSKRRLGKYHTQETKDKISMKNKNKTPHNKYTIIQYDLNMNFIKEWDSSTDASKELNISQSNITAVINKKRKQASGFIWMKK